MENKKHKALIEIGKKVFNYSLKKALKKYFEDGISSDISILNLWLTGEWRDKFYSLIVALRKAYKVSWESEPRKRVTAIFLIFFCISVLPHFWEKNIYASTFIAGFIFNMIVTAFTHPEKTPESFYIFNLLKCLMIWGPLFIVLEAMNVPDGIITNLTGFLTFAVMVFVMKKCPSQNRTFLIKTLLLFGYVGMIAGLIDLANFLHKLS